MKKSIEEPRVDVEDKRNKFRSDMTYMTMVWLKEYIDSGEVFIEARHTWFFQGNRDYKMPTLNIEFGKEVIWIQPSVLTYEEEVGRLSMQGKAATAYISLRSSPDGPWKIGHAFLDTKDEALNE
jgi:hypothetical protein